MADQADAGVETNVEEGSDLDTGVEAGESLGSGDSEDDTDWKAVAGKAQAEADHYKAALTQKRQLRKNAAPTPEVEEEDDEDDDKPLTRKDLRKVLQEEVAPVVAESKVDAQLEKLVPNPEKRKAVKLFYETRIRQTGTSDEAIRADLAAALAIADANRLRKSAEEMTRIANKPNMIPTQGNPADRAPASKEHKFSAEQVATLTATAERIGANPEQFIANAWKNQSR